MKITMLELLTNDLQAQRDFYADVLDLPVNLTSSALEVEVGESVLVFKQAWSDFDGAYHFAFNIPENQYEAAKQWIRSRVSLLRDKTGKEDFESKSWNSTSLYFLDAAGNVHWNGSLLAGLDRRAVDVAQLWTGGVIVIVTGKLSRRAE